MLTISDELKQLYKKDSIPKNLQIYFPALSLTITNSPHIVSESFQLKEGLCSDNDLVFGACESTEVKFTVADITQDLKEQKFTVTQIVNDTYSVLLGTYTVKSAKRQDNLRFKDIVAYDDMKKFEIDVADWYNSLDFTNMTLKQFRSSLCAHVGIVEEDVTLTNDNMLVTKTIEPAQLSGKEALQAIEEINGCFGHIGRDGVLKHIVLQPAYGLYPSEILYPSDVLFPVSDTDTAYVQNEIISESLSMSNFRKVRFEEYTVKEIDKLQIRQEEDDIGAIVVREHERIIETLSGTNISSNKSENAMVGITKIEGATTVTKANPDLDISPDNVATMTNAKNFYVVASNGTESNQATITYELSSLLNGVKDTIEKVNGVTNYVQRVGKYAVTGSEVGWSERTAQTTATYICIHVDNITGMIFSGTDLVVANSKSISTHFKEIKYVGIPTTEAISLRSSGKGLVIYLLKSRLTTPDLAGAIAYLKSQYDTGKPITICYPIVTPIYTPISDLYLTSYKGITNINTTANPQVNITAEFYGDYANTYVIEGNFLVFGKSATELETIARNTFGNMAKRPYRPYNAELNGLPYIELGDVVQFQTNDVVEGYVLSRTLKGIQALKDNFSATGNETRKANFDLNKKVIQLQGKTAIIKKNVDEVSVELTDLAQNTESRFTQTDELISFKVSKDGVIGAINLSSEEATISAKKLNFNGYATFDVDGKITGIKGNLIKTGSIESSNYVVGTTGMKINLDDGTIDTPKFKLSSDGKITAVDGTFSGVIQNERITIDQQFIRFSTSGHIRGYNDEPVLSAGTNTITLGNAYNTNLTILQSQARSIIWGGAFGNSIIQMIGKTIFKTSDFRSITLDDTGIYPDSSVYYALGKASQRFDYAHIRSIYTDSIYHQSGGSLGFFGKTPVSQRTVSKLSTSATQSDIISKVNAMLDVFGDSSGYGMIKL